MAVGQAFGLDPWDAKKRWTKRQLRTALDWLDRQWNRPNLICWYLMRVCETIALVNVKKGTKVSAEQFKLSFGRKKSKGKRRPSSGGKVSKSAWVAAASASRSKRGGDGENIQVTAAPTGMDAVTALMAKGKALRDAKNKVERKTTKAAGL